MWRLAIALSALLAISVGAVLVACGGQEQTAESAAERIGRVASKLEAFDETLYSMGPVAWWRFSEDSGVAPGYVKDYSDLHNPFAGLGRNHGLMHNSPTVVSGATTDNDKALEFSGPDAGPAAMDGSAYLGPYVEAVNEYNDFSLTHAQDHFERTEDAGTSWGDAGQGAVWSPVFTTNGTYYSVDGGVAIITETTGATWGQILTNETYARYDVQVKVKWDTAADGGTLQPGALIANYVDSSNYYRAELRESHSDHKVRLRLSQTISGSTTQLGSDVILDSGNAYSPGDWFYVRLQFAPASWLNAKAWKEGTSQPTDWQIQENPSFLAVGYVGIRSSNSASGQTAQPTVSFDDFRVQTYGMTIHAWMKPTALAFTGSQSPICGPDSGTVPANYIHWIAKGENNAEQEYAFRFYPNTAHDECPDDEPENRDSRISAYMFKPAAGLGAGAFYQESISVNQWINVVAVFDPGDKLDLTAGVSLYVNGVLIQGTAADGGGTSAVKYSHSSYQVVPENGTAKFRVGATRMHADWMQFQGAIDEVAVFPYKLSSEQIQTLYAAALQ